jgi:hypothetical protein
MSVGGSFRFRFNAGSWRESPFPLSPDAPSNASSDTWRSLSIPIGLGDLATGTNTLEVSTGNTTAPVLIANVDLTVVPR